MQPSLSDKQEEFLQQLYDLCKRYRRSGVYSLSLGFGAMGDAYRIEIGLIVGPSIAATRRASSLRLQNVVYCNSIGASSETLEPLQPIDASHSSLPRDVVA